MEILSFYAVSHPSRGNVLSLDPLKKKQGTFLSLFPLSWKKKMQDSNWKGTHVHLNRLEGKAGDISRVIFCF